MANNSELKDLDTLYTVAFDSNVSQQSKLKLFQKITKWTLDNIDKNNHSIIHYIEKNITFAQNMLESGRKNQYFVDHSVANTWILIGSHKIAMKIIEKHSDLEWTNKTDRHKSLVFVSLVMLEEFSKYNDIDITYKFFTPHFIPSLIDLISGSMTWIEQYFAMRLMAFCSCFADPSQVFADIKCESKHNLIKSTLNQAVYSQEILFNAQLDFEEKKAPKYHSNICDKIGGKEHLTKILGEEWKPACYNFAVSYLISCPKISSKELKDVPIECIKDMLADTMHIFKKSYSAKHAEIGCKLTISKSAFDIISRICMHKEQTFRISQNDSILEHIIIAVRSRGSLHCYFNEREVIPILYHIINNGHLPSKYLEDAIFALMDCRDTSWQLRSLQKTVLKFIPCIRRMVEDSLKLLFNVPKSEALDDFICAICSHELCVPATLSCGHSLCYTCLSDLNAAPPDDKKKHSINSKNEDATMVHGIPCPLCRKPIYGELCWDQKLSDFTPNLKIMNNQNTAIRNFSNGFKGSLNEFWNDCKIKNNFIPLQLRKNKLIMNEFNNFCNFMLLETRIYESKENEKNDKIERKNAKLKANKLKLEGNYFFKNGKWNDAIQKYLSALDTHPIFEYVDQICGDRAFYYNNIALAYLKMKDFTNGYRYSLNALSAAGEVKSEKKMKFWHNALQSMIAIDKSMNFKSIHHEISVETDNDNHKCWRTLMFQYHYSWDIAYAGIMRKEYSAKNPKINKLSQAKQIEAFRKVAESDPWLTKYDHFRYMAVYCEKKEEDRVYDIVKKKRAMNAEKEEQKTN